MIYFEVFLVVEGYVVSDCSNSDMIQHRQIEIELLRFWVHEIKNRVLSKVTNVSREEHSIDNL
jgi:hypothetical protein